MVLTEKNVMNWTGFRSSPHFVLICITAVFNHLKPFSNIFNCFQPFSADFNRFQPFSTIYSRTHRTQPNTPLLSKYIHTQCFMHNKSTLFSSYTLNESHIIKYRLSGRTEKGTSWIGLKTCWFLLRIEYQEAFLVLTLFELGDHSSGLLNK